MDKVFDPTKPVKTRDGRKARIICTDRNHIDGSIVALIALPEDAAHGEREVVRFFYSNGQYLRDPAETMPCDLINIPVEKTIFRPVYKDGSIGGSYGTLESLLCYGDSVKNENCVGHIVETFYDNILKDVTYVPK